MHTTAALAIACLAGVAAAQAPTSRPTQTPENPHKIEMDALSRATIDRWEAMEYHLGRAGVKTISFTVKVVAKSMLGDADATGQYTFDGKKGTLKWDNAALGGMLATRGWSQDTFDRMFIPDSHLRELAKTTLTARKQDGGTTILVEGETKGGYKSFHYDADGIARKFTMLVEESTMGELDALVEMTYVKIGRKRVRAGWTVRLEMPMGVFRGTVKIKNKKVGKYHLYDAVTEQQALGEQSIGSTTLTFFDYKINGGITEPKKAVTTAKPTDQPGEKAASQPTSKPAEKAQKGIEKGGEPKKGPPKR